MARKRIITPERKSLSEISFLSTTLLQQGFAGSIEGSARRYDTKYVEAELDEHLGYEKYESTEEAKSNYRNGYTSKTLKSSVGQVEIDIPRDRNAEFEPKIVPRYKRTFQKLKIK